MIRYTILTLNAWKTNGKPTFWNKRRPIMVDFFKKYSPDIACIQEHHPDIQKAILEGVPKYKFINDSFEGWENQSNIYWNKELFTEIDHGTYDIGHSDDNRRLFWVKLLTNNKNKFFVSTAHLTWQGSELYRNSNIDPRILESTNISIKLKEMSNLPLLFTGDMNCGFFPQKIIKTINMQDCFTGLELPLKKTHPARPSAVKEELMADQVLDWIFYNNKIKPIMATIPEKMYKNLSEPVSDHLPVYFIFEFHHDN